MLFIVIEENTIIPKGNQIDLHENSEAKLSLNNKYKLKTKNADSFKILNLILKTYNYT